MLNHRANVGSNGAQYIKRRKYVFIAILITALKHVTMRLMSFWQRLSGSEVGPESGPLCMDAAGPGMTVTDPPKVLPYFAHCLLLVKIYAVIDIAVRNDSTVSIKPSHLSPGDFKALFFSFCYNNSCALNDDKINHRFVNSKVTTKTFHGAESTPRR